MNDENLYTPSTANLASPLPLDQELVLATRLSRFLAFLVDLITFIPAFFLIIACFGWGIFIGQQPSDFSPGSKELMQIFGAIGLMILWFIANAILFHRTGQTFGKKFMKIKIVRTDGTRVSVRRWVFIRHGVIALLGAIPFVGKFVQFVDYLLIFRSSRLCLHDQIADTLVIEA